MTVADRAALFCWMAAMRAKHIPRVAGGVASVREKPVTAAGRRMLRCWMAVMRAKHIPEGGGRCCVGAREAPDSFSRAWKGRGCSDDGCWSIIAAGNRLADAKGQVAQAGLDPIVDVVQKAAGCHRLDGRGLPSAQVGRQRLELADGLSPAGAFGEQAAPAGREAPLSHSSRGYRRVARKDALPRLLNLSRNNRPGLGPDRRGLAADRARAPAQPPSIELLRGTATHRDVDVRAGTRMPWAIDPHM
jgi:hypothetical protein